MTAFNKDNWSIKQAIQDRVNLESLQEWGLDTTLPPKPRYEAPTSPKKHINWYIFIKTCVMECRP